MSSVALLRGGIVHWRMSIEHTDLLFSQKFCVFMSSLALFSTLVDLNGKLSPDRGWRVGSIPTLGQTSVSNCAVMPLTRLCLIEVKAPFGQLKACATENTSPHGQCEGNLSGLNHISNKAHL